jgi:hypothetical protein
MQLNEKCNVFSEKKDESVRDFGQIENILKIENNSSKN